MLAFGTRDHKQRRLGQVGIHDMKLDLDVDKLRSQYTAIEEELASVERRELELSDVQVQLEKILMVIDEKWLTTRREQ